MSPLAFALHIQVKKISKEMEAASLTSCLHDVLDHKHYLDDQPYAVNEILERIISINTNKLIDIHLHISIRWR